MIDQTFSYRAPLRRLDDVYLLPADGAVLSNRGSVRLELSIGPRSCRTYAFRHLAGAACVVPPDEVRALALREGQQIEFELTVRSPEPAYRAPDDLQRSLDAAGVGLDALSPRDRNALFRVIREASDPEIRSARIAAAVAACVQAAKRGAAAWTAQQSNARFE